MESRSGRVGLPPELYKHKETIFRRKVPSGTLKPGAWNEIAVRLHQEGANGGFKGDAPFIMNYFWECIFAGGVGSILPRSHYTPSSLWTTTAAATFSDFRESNRVLGRAEQVHGPSLSPAEAAKTFTTTDGLRIEQVLHEPEIAQAFNFRFGPTGSPLGCPVAAVSLSASFDAEPRSILSGSL